MIVVSNTTPILCLYKIGQLHLLDALFGRVYVPMAVYNEISIAGRGKQGDNIIDTTEYIYVKETQNVLAVNLLRSLLDCGESETIVLGNELGADILVIDEKKARRVAQTNNQSVVGTIGILQLAKDRGLIADMKTHLDNLYANGIWISQKLYHAVLQNNNE